MQHILCINIKTKLSIFARIHVGSRHDALPLDERRQSSAQDVRLCHAIGHRDTMNSDPNGILRGMQGHMLPPNSHNALSAADLALGSQHVFEMRCICKTNLKGFAAVAMGNQLEMNEAMRGMQPRGLEKPQDEQNEAGPVLEQTNKEAPEAREKANTSTIPPQNLERATSTAAPNMHESETKPLAKIRSPRARCSSSSYSASEKKEKNTKKKKCRKKERGHSKPKCCQKVEYVPIPCSFGAKPFMFTRAPFLPDYICSIPTPPPSFRRSALVIHDADPNNVSPSRTPRVCTIMPRFNHICSSSCLPYLSPARNRCCHLPQLCCSKLHPLPQQEILGSLPPSTGLRASMVIQHQSVPGPLTTEPLRPQTCQSQTDAIKTPMMAIRPTSRSKTNEPMQLI